MRLKRKYPRIEVLWEDHHSDKEDSWTEPTKAVEDGNYCIVELSLKYLLDNWL